MKMTNQINTKLPLSKCWQMVNRISSKAQVEIAKEWLMANEVISNDEYDELMRAVSYIYRELNHNRW